MYIIDHSACTFRADLNRLEYLTMCIKESLYRRELQSGVIHSARVHTLLRDRGTEVPSRHSCYSPYLRRSPQQRRMRKSHGVLTRQVLQG
ncbi:hypothetical protein DPMN_129436 [Dreissena polymorpha]|uniref:Uncharacterized protein n=1 Tax=Dreissena polymorpha TaxID=45954 RepID=A0A9D4H5R2_DREPO|nr:hypothetical protein DPMN_129436 [Dreissena polymorpha]